MNFLSIERPTMASGRPGYPWDRPIAALPGIKVEPVTNGWRVSIWIAHAPNEAREYHKFVETAVAACDLLIRYADNPEKVMKEDFLWPGVGNTPKQQRAALVETDMGF